MWWLTKQWERRGWEQLFRNCGFGQLYAQQINGSIDVMSGVLSYYTLVVYIYLEQLPPH